MFTSSVGFKCGKRLTMWKASAGHNVQIDANDDDDWETDPDFVVS